MPDGAISPVHYPVTILGDTIYPEGSLQFDRLILPLIPLLHLHRLKERLWTKLKILNSRSR